MTSPTNALQIASAAALLGGTDADQSVFAPGQSFDDVYPRVTLEVPQRLGRDTSCSVAADMIVTVHSWARGPDCTLIAGAIADQVIAVLSQKLALAGWRVSSWSFENSRPVGDPDPLVEHVVTVFRYSVQPTG